MRRVLIAGCSLAFLAACVNADFMIRLGVSVSHLTGDLSKITAGATTSGGGWSHEAAILCLTILGFVAGSTAAGFFIHHPALDFARPYGRSVISIGGLLLLSSWVTPHSIPASCLFAASACGLQNALATRYRGMILRTTHITGLLTDLGQTLGMRLRGNHVESWKITTPLLLAATFTLGAATGTLVQLGGLAPVTTACGCIYIAGGAAWSVAKRRYPGKPA